MTSTNTVLGPAPAEVAARLRERGATEYDGHPGWWRWNGHYYPWPEAIDVVLAAPPLPPPPTVPQLVWRVLASPAFQTAVPVAAGVILDVLQVALPAVVAALPAGVATGSGVALAGVLRALPGILRALRRDRVKSP